MKVERRQDELNFLSHTLFRFSNSGLLTLSVRVVISYLRFHERDNQYNPHVGRED